LALTLETSVAHTVYQNIPKCTLNIKFLPSLQLFLPYRERLTRRTAPPFQGGNNGKVLAACAPFAVNNWGSPIFFIEYDPFGDRLPACTERSLRTACEISNEVAVSQSRRSIGAEHRLEAYTLLAVARRWPWPVLRPAQVGRSSGVKQEMNFFWQNGGNVFDDVTP
jgi:hypothetical protein